MHQINDTQLTSYGVWVDAGGFCLKPSIGQFVTGTSPVDKKKIYETIQSCNGQFTVECVKKLTTENHIRSKDLHSLRACYELALEFPAAYHERVPSLIPRMTRAKE